MKKIRQSILLISLFTIMTISSTTYGMGRSIFVGPPTEPQCRNCHDNLSEFPMLRNINPDRHHMLIGTTIPSISRSKAPDAIGAGNAGAPYDCFSCHLLTVNPDTGENSVSDQPFRNCLQCHPVWRVTGRPGWNNVHHETQTFQQRQCHVCHNNGGGGMGGGGMGGGGRMGR